MKDKTKELPKTILFLRIDLNFERGFNYYCEVCKPVIERIAKDRFREIYDYFVKNENTLFKDNGKDKWQNRTIVNLTFKNNTNMDLICDKEFLLEDEKILLFNLYEKIKIKSQKINTRNKVYLLENKNFNELVGSMKHLIEFYN